MLTYESRTSNAHKKRTRIYGDCKSLSDNGASGGIGRRAGFRFLYRKVCGFDSHLAQSAAWPAIHFRELLLLLRMGGGSHRDGFGGSKGFFGIAGMRPRGHTIV